MSMEPNDKEETTESTRSESSDTNPPSKLRDLKPEKDPMGAGRESPGESETQERN